MAESDGIDWRRLAVAAAVDGLPKDIDYERDGTAGVIQRLIHAERVAGAVAGFGICDALAELYERVRSVPAVEAETALETARLWRIGQQAARDR